MAVCNSKRKPHQHWVSVFVCRCASWGLLPAFMTAYQLGCLYVSQTEIGWTLVWSGYFDEKSFECVQLNWRRGGRGHDLFKEFNLIAKFSVQLCIITWVVNRVCKPQYYSKDKSLDFQDKNWRGSSGSHCWQKSLKLQVWSETQGVCSNQGSFFSCTA